MDPLQRIPAEVELQAVKEEFDLAKKKIERYEHLVTTLYDELDNLRNSICNKCKIKLVPGTAYPSSASRRSLGPTPPQGRVFGIGALQPQTSPDSRQTPILRIAEISNDSSPSSTRLVSIGPNLVPPQVEVDNACSPMAKADWSVVHNHEVKQIMNVHLAHTLKFKGKVTCVKFSLEGKYLAVGVVTGDTYLYDMKTMSKRVLVEHPARNEPSKWSTIWSIKFSPDDKYVAIGGSDGRIRIWNIAERLVLAMFVGHEYPVFSVDFSPDGRFLVSGSFDATVRVWRMRDGSSRQLLDNTMSLVTSVSFSPDGRYLAAANIDGMLRIWDFRNGLLLEKWKAKGHPERLWSMVFTADGKGLLSGGDDTIMRLWDVSSLTRNPSGSRKFEVVKDGNVDEEKETLTFRGHTESIYSVSTLPDSRLVLSGSRDSSVRLWDARTCIWHCTLNGHQKAITTTDTSSDGCHLASGSEDYLVRIWRYEQAG